MRFLDVWYTRFDADKVIAEFAATADKAAVKAAKKALAKAQTRTSLGSLAKFAERVDGGYRIKQQPPVIVRPPETMSDEFEQVIRQGLAGYASSLAPDRRVVLDRYHYEDFARKVVGVGSVGTEAMMVLLMGDREDDPLFLQLKEATPRCSPPTRATASTPPGRAGRARPAAHAGRQRRLPGLGHRHRPAAASSTSANCATRRARPRSRR